MKKSFILFCVLSTMGYANSLELGVLSPIQLNGPDTSVNGFRAGLFWTKNRSVQGLDLHLIGNTKQNFEGVSLGGIYDETKGNFTGVKIPFWGVNKVDGNFSGIQLGTVNIVGKRMYGFQGGFVNYISSGDGLQLGGYNMAYSMKGLQIGLINYCENLNGVQLGLANIAKNSEIFQVLPLINFNLKF